MQPLSLTLKGFRGIRDGLGRDVLTLDFERLADGAELVAIAGANGRGKTTVMDNMHPYLTMPSRAAMAGPGGFSYYDHVCLPENEKDLIWAHDGRSYRSQVVIRVNGRRKTEAFLLMLADDGAWKPVVLDDGTVSDGKVDTYRAPGTPHAPGQRNTAAANRAGLAAKSSAGRCASAHAGRVAAVRGQCPSDGRERYRWCRACPFAPRHR
jgi:hypothetical protein